MALEIRQLSYALGVEVIGVNLSDPVDEDIFNEIRKLLAENCVLVFRSQTLTAKQHVAFSRQFGELDKNTGHRNAHPEHSEIVVNNPKPITKPLESDIRPPRVVGQEWHTDRSHLPVAAMASLLYGIEVPEIGGDTLFANIYRAYETLSAGMKKLVEGLDGVHMDGANNPCAAHPIARTHPETRRKALFVGEQVELIVGMTAAESKPLLQYLTQHAVQPQNVYRHRWRSGDLVIWDNRCTLHMALGDYDRSKIRHMERTTVDGAVSGYVYEGPRG